MRNNRLMMTAMIIGMLIIVLMVGMAACGSSDSGTKAATATPQPLTPLEAGFKRYIDSETGIACYAKAISQVAALFSCATIGENE